MTTTEYPSYPSVLKTNNTKLARFLWIVEQATNPPKITGCLGKLESSITEGLGQKVLGRCCLGNATGCLMYDSERTVGFNTSDHQYRECWQNESMVLPAAVAQLLNITQGGDFKLEHISCVWAFMRGRFGAIKTFTRDGGRPSSLAGVNDQCDLTHEEMGILILECFENEWLKEWAEC